jgi:hypothetical protein
MSTNKKPSGGNKYARPGLHKPSLWFPVETWEKAKSSAERHHRSPNQEIVAMIEACLAAGDDWQLWVRDQPLPRGRGRPRKEK